MRINPTEKAMRNGQPSAEAQARIKRVTRWVAIAVAFLGTYFFMLKIMFL